MGIMDLISRLRGKTTTSRPAPHHCPHPLVDIRSRKGGCGKTLCATNIALALAERKKTDGTRIRVGIVCADPDSPFLPRLLGLTEPLSVTQDHRIIPATSHGIQVVSAGLFQKGRTVFSKTGSQNQRIIRDLIMGTAWDEIDVLVVDSPAGNSDELRAVEGTAGPNMVGAIIVTQPNLADTLMGVIDTARRHGTPILGTIENMHDMYTTAPQVTIEQTCTRERIPLLGRIPLMRGFLAQLEQGDPRIPARHMGAIDAAVDAIMGEVGL